MRLIDADALVKKIWEKHKETEKLFDVCVDELKDIYCGVVAVIDEQPTAYDVDKVVAELEALEDTNTREVYLTHHIDCDKAVEIVRKGGV